MDDEKTIVRVGNRSTAVPYGGGPFGLRGCEDL